VLPAILVLKLRFHLLCNIYGANTLLACRCLAPPLGGGRRTLRGTGHRLPGFDLGWTGSRRWRHRGKHRLAFVWRFLLPACGWRYRTGLGDGFCYDGPLCWCAWHGRATGFAYRTVVSGSLTISTVSWAGYVVVNKVAFSLFHQTPLSGWLTRLRFALCLCARPWFAWTDLAERTAGSAGKRLSPAAPFQNAYLLLSFSITAGTACCLFLMG